MTSREFRGKSPLTAMLLAHRWQSRKEDAAERCSYLYIYSVLLKEQNLCVPARSMFPMRKIRPSVAAVAPGAARGTSAPLAACSRGCGASQAAQGKRRALGGEFGNPGLCQREITVVLLHWDVQNSI